MCFYWEWMLQNLSQPVWRQADGSYTMKWNAICAFKEGQCHGNVEQLMKDAWLMTLDEKTFFGSFFGYNKKNMFDHLWMLFKKETYF